MITRRSNLATRSSVGLVFLTLAVLTGVSCSPAPDPLLDMLDTQLSNIKIDSLSRTMEFVVSPERFQKNQFEEKLAASLNRWAKSESDLMEQDKWQLDPATSEVLEAYASLPSVQRVPKLGFINTDSYFIQQHYWFEKLGQRLAANPDLGPFELYRLATQDVAFSDDDEVDPLAEVMQATHADMAIDNAKQLAITLKIFDWVVRNIHLLPDNDLVGDKEIDDLRLNDAESLATAGVPGLGYTRFPWHALLYSRGDYVDRAKLFMMMIQHFDIDSVMLVVHDESENDEAGKQPWAVGVLIGEQLHLFDTKMGLPIPGSKPGSIATFSELKQDSKLLTSLDLSVNESLKDDTKYWVKPNQLDDVDALVLATPESLSYRMWELENKLVGDARMTLVIQPSEVIAKMPNIEGLNYGVWDIAFKTHVFRRALRDAIADASFKDDIRDKIRWYFADELYIDEFVQYRTARSKYFNGLFDAIRNDGNLNAIELFCKMIYKDKKIDSLATDKRFQRQLALTQGKQSSAEFASTIQGVQRNMRLVRRDSGFFLSQCHFDNGNFGTAVNWLKRLERIEDTTRWQAAINYLRGRSFEAQRDYDSAIQAYQQQDSEQFHGDIIRARLLKQLTDEL